MCIKCGINLVSMQKKTTETCNLVYGRMRELVAIVTKFSSSMQNSDQTYTIISLYQIYRTIEQRIDRRKNML